MMYALIADSCQHKLNNSTVQPASSEGEDTDVALRSAIVERAGVDHPIDISIIEFQYIDDSSTSSI